MYMYLITCLYVCDLPSLISGTKVVASTKHAKCFQHVHILFLNNEGHTMSCFGQVSMLILCFVNHDQSHAIVCKLHRIET